MWLVSPQVTAFPAAKWGRTAFFGYRRDQLWGAARVFTQALAAADAATPRLTGRSFSQAFGLATVLDYHRRAAELNRWAVVSLLLKRNRER